MTGEDECLDFRMVEANGEDVAVLSSIRCVNADSRANPAQHLRRQDRDHPDRKGFGVCSELAAWSDLADKPCPKRVMRWTPRGRPCSGTPLEI